MDTNAIKKIPPHSPEAEQSVIGSMLYENEALIYACEHLSAEDFYNRQYGLIFEAIQDLYEARKEVDFVTLVDKLKEKKAPPEICESSFTAELVAAVPSAANIKQYCNIVSEKAILRKLIKTTEEISVKGYLAAEPLDDLLIDAEKKVFDLVQRGDSDSFTPISQIVLNTLDNIQKAAKSGGSVTGVPTGFNDLDYKTAGMHPSDLVLIAARPSMGKTAFVLNIAEYAALRKDFHVAIFSLEMSKEQLVNRLIAMESRVNSQSLRTGQMADQDWDRIVESGGMISKSNLMIDDTPGISVTALRSKCRKLQIEHGLDMIIIDYLQLMSGGKRSESRQNEISEISRSLKAIARELSVPVLALSQLSRAVEQRPDHRPMLSDLRESGAIEQDADVVMFIYRDDYYNHESEDKGIAEIIIAKQRNGPIGTVKLLWQPDYTRFVSIDWKNGN